MIYLGLSDVAKADVVAAYRRDHAIQKVYILSPERFAPPFAGSKMLDPNTEADGRRDAYIDWPSIIQYRFFYKLMQEVDGSTLIVINECMRTQNRYDLTYNCIRNFLNQTTHQIIFQHLPLIDAIDDFMILFDFDTRSRWKRERFSVDLLHEARVHIDPAPIEIRPLRVQVDDRTRAAYAREKAALLAEVRGDPDKDPHLIPRNLLLVSGKAKLGVVDPARRYVGRNNRFKSPNLETYRDAAGPGERVVLELPHSFIDFADFLAVSRQRHVEVLVADTKADEWYFHRFQDWTRRVNDAQAALHG